MAGAVGPGAHCRCATLSRAARSITSALPRDVVLHDEISCRACNDHRRKADRSGAHTPCLPNLDDDGAAIAQAERMQTPRGVLKKNG